MARKGSKQTAHYVLDGTEYEVKTGVLEMVFWEKAHKGQPFHDGSGAAYFERQAWLIWSASKRAGQHTMDFETWLKSIEDTWMDDPDEVAADEAEAASLEDPTGGSGTDS